jgi:hypothetical protein
MKSSWRQVAFSFEWPDFDYYMDQQGPNGRLRVVLSSAIDSDERLD